MKLDYDDNHLLTGALEIYRSPTGGGLWALKVTDTRFLRFSANLPIVFGIGHQGPTIHTYNSSALGNMGT